MKRRSESPAEVAGHLPNGEEAGRWLQLLHIQNSYILAVGWLNISESVKRHKGETRLHGLGL